MRYRPAHVTPRGRRLVTDGGTPEDDGDEEPDDVEASSASTETSGEPTTEADVDETEESPDRSTVDVMDAGEAEPADPKWEPPDVDDIPEFEVRADQPVVEPGGDAGEVAGEPAGERGAAGGGSATDATPGGTGEDPTAGMPNDARAPGATTVSSQGTEAFVAALELCARLPEDVALPEEAADLVPAAVEAELEQDIQSFAAAEFDNQRPHVDTLDFEERDGDIWLRIRMGIPSGDFEDLDPERLRTFALQELEGVL